LAPGPDALRPDALRPDALEPGTLEPDALGPDAPGADELEPDALEPDVLGPDAPRPDALEPDAPGADVMGPDVVSPETDPDRAAPAGESSVSGGGGMWAGSGGVWAIGVRVGSAESGRRDDPSAVPPEGALRSPEAPAERLPRALRALDPGAGRAGPPDSLGGSVGG
jgi:hypothetical protein